MARLKYQAGFTLTEVLVALALIVVIFVPVYLLYHSTLNVGLIAINQSQAYAHAQDGLEAIYAIHHDAALDSGDEYEFPGPGSYYLALDGIDHYWKLVTSPDDPEVIPLERGFSREITISSIWRDEDGAVYHEEAEGLILDESTKLVTVSVSWVKGKERTVSLSTYVADF